MMVTEVNDGLSDHMMEIATLQQSSWMHGGDRCHIKIVLAILYHIIIVAFYAISMTSYAIIWPFTPTAWVAFYAISVAFYVISLTFNRVN